MNLIICHTPFQMYFLEKIIKKYPKEDFYLINYFYTDSKKRKFYFQRLSTKCVGSEEIHCPTGLHLFIKTFITRCRLKNKSYHRVFISSIDSIMCQVILSSVQFEQLITFDDGLANISPTSVYYQETQSKKTILANKFLGNKYNIQDIKELTSKHYSIFDAKNITSKVEKIDIVDSNGPTHVAPDDLTLKKSPISILLGQPIYETEQENVAFFDEVLSRFEIDYYFPHPRETYQIRNVNYIDTEYIFEEYIVDLLNEYEEIIIYSIYSTAVLSFLNQTNISIKMLTVNEFVKFQDVLREFGIKDEEFK